MVYGAYAALSDQSIGLTGQMDWEGILVAIFPAPANETEHAATVSDFLKRFPLPSLSDAEAA